MDDLQRNILDAIRLSRLRQPNMGNREPRTFIFNEPGDIYQQKTPVVEAPSMGNRSVGIESNAERQALMQYIQRIMNQINQQNQFRLIFKNMLPMLRGRMGRANMQMGPFVQPSNEAGRPDFGFGVKGRIPF